MAGKLSELAAASALVGTEKMEVLQGTNKVTTPAAIATYVDAPGEAEAAAQDEANLRAAAADLTDDLDVGGQEVTNAADPTAADSLTTKGWVEALVQGLLEGLDVKASCRVASTANLTLSGEQTIDGVAVVAGDRVLVKNQTDAEDNGIYVCASGAWTRSADANSSADVTAGMYTFIAEGTANADSRWVLTTNDPIVLGTTALVFSQFSGAAEIIAGTGLSKSGNTLSLSTTTQDDLANTKGELSKSVAAGGTVTLTSGEAAALVLRFTGAAGSDVTVEVPATNGRSWLVVNEQTDNSKSVVVKAASGSRTIYLGPGRARRVAVVNGELRSDDEKAIILEVDVTLVRGSTGDTNTAICKLPANVILRRFSVRGIVSKAGGTSTLSGGSTSGGAEVMAATVAPVAGALLGESPSHWGTEMALTGSAFYSVATTLYLKNAVTGSATTDGSVRVTVEAVLL